MNVSLFVDTWTLPFSGETGILQFISEIKRSCWHWTWYIPISMSTDTGRDPCHLHLHPFIIIAEVLPSLPVTVFTHPVTHTHKCESFSTFVVQDWSFFWYYALFPNSNSINNPTNEYSSFGLTIIMTFGNILYQVDIDNIISLKFRMEGSNKLLSRAARRAARLKKNESKKCAYEVCSNK